MNKEFYNKLVDLYAGHELPSELEDQMELAAFGDPELSHDMSSLRRTVEMLGAERNSIEMTEESYQRVLMKIYASGTDIQTSAPTPSYFQYHLPMQG